MTEKSRLERQAEAEETELLIEAASVAVAAAAAAVTVSAVVVASIAASEQEASSGMRLLAVETLRLPGQPFKGRKGRSGGDRGGLRQRYASLRFPAIARSRGVE